MSKEKSPMEALVGKTFLWQNGEDYQKQGIVVAAKEGYGYTIVNANDPDDYLTCSKGPLSPKWTLGPEESLRSERREEYFLLAVRAGFYCCEACEVAAGNEDGTGVNPGVSSCSFS